MIITLDLETTGTDWQNDRILLNGYRLDRSGDVIHAETNGVDGRLESLLSDPSNVLCGHNIKFDALFLSRRGYNVACALEDTRVMAYVCWPEEESHGLKELSYKKLGKHPTDLSDILFKPLKADRTYFTTFSYLDYYLSIGDKLVRKDYLEAYHKEDILNVDRLRALMVPPKWYWNVEYPLTRILFEAELYGCPLDTTHLGFLKVEFEGKLKEAKEALGASDEFNPGSQQQVAKKLQEQGINLEEHFGKTKKGNISIDKLGLKHLAWKGNTFAKMLLEYRRYSKLLNTYIDPFIEGGRKDGRIHGSINQAGSEDIFGDGSEGTNTGRLSSSNPNLQNIPARTKEGKKVRKAFIACEEYPYLANSDLEQIEPRIVGHFSQSSVLIKAYNNNIDTHSMMSSLIFGRKIEEYDKKIIANNPQLYTERFIGKTSWLATAYRCSPRKLLWICEINSDSPLQLDLKPYINAFKDYKKSHSFKYPCFPGYPNCQDCLRKELRKNAEETCAKWAFFENVQDKFKKANPEIMDWCDEQINKAKILGYVSTIGGRRIPLPDIQLDPTVKGNKSLIKKAERKAINTPVQGSCADALKLTIVRLQRELGNNGKVIVNVHDEVLTLLKSKELVDVVKNCMETTISLNNIPVKSSTKLVKDWSEKE